MKNKATIKLTSDQLYLIINQLDAASEPAHRSVEELEIMQILVSAKLNIDNPPRRCGPGRDHQKLTAEEELSWLRNPDRMGQ